MDETYRAVSCGEEVQRPLEPGILYCQTLPELEKPWAVFFLCPCGCKDEVNIPVLDPGSWSLRLDGVVPTISPSIARLTGCKSHFFITDGKVKW